MLVDRDNFAQASEQIQKLLKQNIKYIGFDLEMTGIKGDFDEFQYDLPFERFGRNKTIAQKFKIIQLGLTFFNQLKDNHFEAYPFTFYVFPKEIPGLFSPPMSLEIGAVEFLNGNSMDWNRWLKKGIGYVPLSLEKRLTEYVFAEEKKQGDDELSETIYVGLGDEDKIKIDRIQGELEKFVLSKEKNYVITEYNSFLRRYYHKFLREKYPQLHKDVEEKNQILLTKFDSEQEKITYMKELEIKRQGVFSSYFGITQIIKLIIESKVPVIGHNCYMDLLFIYDSFIEPFFVEKDPRQKASPLDYHNWKENLHNKFHTIFDTKYISSSYENNLFQSNTTLELLKDKILQHKDMFQAVTVALPKEFQDYDFLDPTKSAQRHEAGFDSYLTGWVYLNMVSRMKPQLVKDAENVIFNMKSFYDLQLDLVEEKPKYPSIIYVLKENNRSRFNSFQKQNPNMPSYLLRKEVQKLCIQDIKQTAVNKQNESMIFIKCSFDNNYYVELKLQEKMNADIQGQFTKDLEKLKKCGFDVKTYDMYALERRKIADEKK